MILIVSSRFDKTGEVVRGLQDSCINFLNKNGEKHDLIEVPGAVEIPVTIQYFLGRSPSKYSAAIALGCIIKGETDHYEWVMNACQQGLTRVALDTGKPVIQGVLACPDESTAIARKHHGEAYARTTLEMRDLLNALL